MLATRRYGDRGPTVVLLHGGPGARGYMGTLGTTLATWCRVLEPLQRRSGGAPLTVQTHVADLALVLDELCPRQRPVVVGHSFGAMLALSFAAGHPDRVRALVLVGCGTYDETARAELERRRAARARSGGAFGGRWPSVRDESHDAIVDDLPLADEMDLRGLHETWADVLRLQAEGVEPARFSRIAVPVVMVHGAEDVHPGRSIRDSLAPHVQQLTYEELPWCGHWPWLERRAGDRFLELLRQVIRA